MHMSKLLKLYTLNMHGFCSFFIDISFISIKLQKKRWSTFSSFFKQIKSYFFYLLNRFDVLTNVSLIEHPRRDRKPDLKSRGLTHFFLSPWNYLRDFPTFHVRSIKDSFIISKISHSK